MATDKFDEILLSIIEKEEQKMRADFTARNPNNYTERRKNTLGGYFRSLYEGYKNDNAVFDEVNIQNQGQNKFRALSYGDEAMDLAFRRLESKLSYASIFGMKTMYNLCVAKDIKDAIDKHFEKQPNDKLCTQMKEYVDKKLSVDGKTDAEKKLVGEIKKQFNQFINDNGTTTEFLDSGYKIFGELNDVMNEIPSVKYFWETPLLEIKDNFSLEDALYEAHRAYAAELKNTAICHLNYRANSAIEPEDFLDCHKKGKYSDDAEEFANNMFDELAESVGEQSFEIKASGIALKPDDFLINGNVADNKYDLIAAIVSGKKVEVNVFDDDKPMAVQPEFYVLEKEKPQVSKWEKTIGMSISEFFEELWESIKDALGVSDRERARKMNEEIKGSENRLKTSFSEIIDNNFSDKLVSQEKREKIKAKELEKSAPTKK